jgi:hypothetical protein
MSAVKIILNDNFGDKFNAIIQNYKDILNNITNISDDIKKLEHVHNMYINTGKLDMLNNSIYVDDIKHQIDIIKIEYDYMSVMFQKNLNKFYRDLFKLYNKIVKNLLTIYKENKDIITKIWNNSDKINGETNDFKKLKKNIKIISDATRSGGVYASETKIFEEIKKKYYSKIKLYDELQKVLIYNIEDISIIFTEVEQRLQDLKLSKELVQINLLDVQHKTDKGILGQTFVMDLNGKVDRINIDYCIILKLLESIVNIHTTLSNKYNNLSLIIAKTVSYDEDTSDSSNSPNIIKTKKKDIMDIFVDNKSQNQQANDNTVLENEINKFED